MVLTESGLCKLIDFGMSKEMQRSNFAVTMVGTTQYMPPEQLNNQEYNHKVDIWSFGVLIYQLMAFEYPFMKKSERPEIGAMRACSKKYRPLPEFYSISLRNLVAKILIKDPSKRPDIHQVLNMPILYDALTSYVKSEIFRSEVARLLNQDPERANVFLNLQSTEPEQIQELAVQSPATFEMLCPHEAFIQSEGLEEYYQHTVRRFVKGLTLVPDGQTIEQF